jgi:hypothetical protein
MDALGGALPENPCDPADVLALLDLNQVLVSFDRPEQARRVIAEIHADGTCWCGGTVCHGHTAMRISISCWATTDADVERSAAAMIRIAKSIGR